MSSQPTELPPGWVAAKVSEVGEVRLGRHRSPAKQTQRYSAQYVRAANITTQGLDLHDILEMDFSPAERETYLLKDGDVLLAEASGSAQHVGRAAVWRNELPECYFQNTVIRFRSQVVSPDYAMLVFRYFSLAGTFASAAKGSGILHLGASRFSALPFQLPPGHEQVRIVQEVDLRMQQLNQDRQSLGLAASLARDQVTEIVRVASNGELLKRGPQVTTPGDHELESALDLLNRVRVENDQSPIYHRPLHAGPFPIPSNWIWVSIGQVGEVAIGRQRAPQYQQGEYMRPYLRVANVREDYIDTTDILEMNFTPEEYETYALQWGDIILNEGQSPELVGRPAMFRDDVPGACFQNSLLRFRATSAVDPDFALLVFLHYLRSGEFTKHARWTTNIAHLSLGRFSEMPFPLPPITEQQRIAAEARQQLELSKQQEQEALRSLERLPLLEEALLSAATSGQLVPQDAKEESASSLLAKQSASPATKPRSAPPRPTQQRAHSRTAGTAQSLPDSSLAQILREAGHSLTLTELFAMAGYDKNSTYHVEHFYLSLRQELGQSIRLSKNGFENPSVEVIDNAAR